MKCDSGRSISSIASSIRPRATIPVAVRTTADRRRSTDDKQASARGGVVKCGSWACFRYVTVPCQEPQSFHGAGNGIDLLGHGGVVDAAASTPATMSPADLYVY